MRVSASKTALLMACGAWARDDAEWAAEPPNDDFAFGTAVHAFCERYIASGDGTLVEGVAELARYRAVCEQAKLFINVNRKPFWLPEVAFAWDAEADTARQLPKREHRDYSEVRPHEMPGTADVVWIEDDTAHVLDWKTGRDAEYARPQLKTLALMVARSFGVSRAVTHMVFLSENGAREETEALEPSDLAVIAFDLSGAIADAVDSSPKPGSHCTGLYCPHRLHCATTRTAMDEVVPVERLTKGASPESDRRLAFRMSVEIQSAEHAAWLLPRVNLLRDAAEGLREALKAYAESAGGIPSAPGKVWGPITSNRKQFDKAKAEALLRMLGASEEQIAGCSYDASRTEFRETNLKTRKSRAA